MCAQCAFVLLIDQTKSDTLKYGQNNLWIKQMQLFHCLVSFPDAESISFILFLENIFRGFVCSLVILGLVGLTGRVDLAQLFLCQHSWKLTQIIKLKFNSHNSGTYLKNFHSAGLNICNDKMVLLLLLTIWKMNIKCKLSIASLASFIVLISLNKTGESLDSWPAHYHHKSNQFKQIHVNPYGPIPPNYNRFGDYQNNTYYHSNSSYLFWFVHIRTFFGPRFGLRGPFGYLRLNNKNLVNTKNNKFISLL